MQPPARCRQRHESKEWPLSLRRRPPRRRETKKPHRRARRRWKLSQPARENEWSRSRCLSVLIWSYGVPKRGWLGAGYGFASLYLARAQDHAAQTKSNESERRAEGAGFGNHRDGHTHAVLRGENIRDR